MLSIPYFMNYTVNDLEFLRIDIIKLLLKYDASLNDNGVLSSKFPSVCEFAKSQNRMLVHYFIKNL